MLSKIGIEQPILEDILSWDRIIRMTNPKFVETLEKACILLIPKKAPSKVNQNHIEGD